MNHFQVFRYKLTEVRAEVSELFALKCDKHVQVTHDQDEAARDCCGDERRQVVQQDEPSEVYRHPCRLGMFVGEANTIQGMASWDSADTPLGSINLVIKHGPGGGYHCPEEVVLVDGADGSEESRFLRPRHAVCGGFRQ